MWKATGLAKPAKRNCQRFKHDEGKKGRYSRKGVGNDNKEEDSPAFPIQSI